MRAPFSLTGYLVYHRTTQRVAVRLDFPQNWTNDSAVICEIGASRSTHHITMISPPEGRAHRIITLDNGNKVFIAAKDMSQDLPEDHRWAARIDKAERSSLGLLVGISLLVTALFAGVAYMVFPKLADTASHYIPKPLIDEVSDATLFQLDAVFFEDSRLPDARHAALQTKYERIREQAGIAEDIALLFRASPVMGPNALALPGGPIILLDELVEIAPSDEGIIGVLAHELAHITLRHNEKTIARDSLYALAAIMMTGGPDIAASTDVIKSLVFSGYSRDFEEEADILARSWLQQNGYDIAAFDEMLRVLYTHDCEGRDICDRADNGSSGWFDTHPSLQERLSLQGQ